MVVLCAVVTPSRAAEVDFAEAVSVVQLGDSYSAGNGAGGYYGPSAPDSPDGALASTGAVVGLAVLAALVLLVTGVAPRVRSRGAA
jgi:hypothetical protein